MTWQARTELRFAGWTCRSARSVADAPSIVPRHVGKRITLYEMALRIDNGSGDISAHGSTIVRK